MAAFASASFPLSGVGGDPSTDAAISLPDPEGKLHRWLQENRTLVDAQILAAFPDNGFQPEAYQTAKIFGTNNNALAGTLPNYPAAPPLEVNTIYQPTGATRYTRAAFLMTTANKDKLVNWRLNNPEGSMRSLSVGTGTQTGFSSEIAAWGLRTGFQLHPLSPRPLSPYLASEGSAFGSDQMLWLVPFVDARYFWQHRIREFTGGESGQGPWGRLISDIGFQMTGSNVSPAMTAMGNITIPDAYLSPHPIAISGYGNCAMAMDIALWSINRRLVPAQGTGISASTDGYHVVDPDFAQTQIVTSLNHNPELKTGGEIRRRLIRGGDIDTSIRPTPSQVVIVCPRYENGYLASIQRAVYSGTSDERSTFPTITDPNSNPSVTSQVGVWSTVAYGDGTKARELATKYGQDWYAWRARQFDYTFAGVIPWTFTGYEDAALYHVGSPLPGGGMRMETRVWSLPPDVVVKTQLSRNSQRNFFSGSSTYCVDPDEQLPPVLRGTIENISGDVQIVVHGLINSKIVLEDVEHYPVSPTVGDHGEPVVVMRNATNSTWLALRGPGATFV